MDGVRALPSYQTFKLELVGSQQSLEAVQKNSESTHHPRKAEILASSSLQDGATKWQYFLKESSTHPPTRPNRFFFECVPTPIVPPGQHHTEDRRVWVR